MTMKPTFEETIKQLKRLGYHVDWYGVERKVRRDDIFIPRVDLLLIIEDEMRRALAGNLPIKFEKIDDDTYRCAIIIVREGE